MREAIHYGWLVGLIAATYIRTLTLLLQANLPTNTPDSVKPGSAFRNKGDTSFLYVSLGHAEGKVVTFFG
jgi:hypothetical protein